MGINRTDVDDEDGHGNVSLQIEAMVQDIGVGVQEDDNVNMNKKDDDEEIHHDAGIKRVHDGNVSVSKEDGGEVHDHIVTAGELGEQFGDEDDCGLDDGMGEPPKKKRTKRFGQGVVEATQSGSIAEMNGVENVNEEGGLNVVEHDPFEFVMDDSYNDPTYQQPKRRAPLPSSAKKRPLTSSTGILPEMVKRRTDHVEKEQKRQKIDPRRLEFLVHRLAKAKRINLAMETLPLSFFNELVRLYGAVPGGAGLAPYTSGTDMIRSKYFEPMI